MTELISKNEIIDMNQTDNNGWNLLHWAARYDRLEIMDTFMKRVKYNVKDTKGNFPIHIACKYGKVQIVDYLLQYEHKAIKEAQRLQEQKDQFRKQLTYDGVNSINQNQN